MKKLLNIILVIMLFVGLIPINVMADTKEKFIMVNSASDTLTKKEGMNTIVKGESIDIWVKRIVNNEETQFTDEYTVEFSKANYQNAVSEVAKGQIGNQWHYKGIGELDTAAEPCVIRAIIKKNGKKVGESSYSIYVKEKYGLAIQGSEQTNFKSGSEVTLWAKDYSNRENSNSLKNGEKVVFSVSEGSSILKEGEVEGQYYATIKTNKTGTVKVSAKINDVNYIKSFTVINNSKNSNNENTGSYYLQVQSDYTSLSSRDFTSRVVGDNIKIWLKNSKNDDTENFSLKEDEIKKVKWTTSSSNIVEINEGLENNQYFANVKLLKEGNVTIIANITDKNNKTITSTFKISSKQYKLALQATNNHGVKYNSEKNYNETETLWIKSGKQPIEKDEIKQITGWTCSLDANTYDECSNYLGIIEEEKDPSKQLYLKYNSSKLKDKLYVLLSFKDKYDIDRKASFVIDKNEIVKAEEIGGYQIKNLVGTTKYDSNSKKITTKVGNKFILIPTGVKPNNYDSSSIKYNSTKLGNFTIDNKGEITAVKETGESPSFSYIYVSYLEKRDDITVVIEPNDEKENKFELSAKTSDKKIDIHNNISTIYLNGGSDLTFSAKFNNSDITNDTKFTTSDSNILEINNGKINVKDKDANKFVILTANYINDNKEYIKSYKIFVGIYKKENQISLILGSNNKNVKLADNDTNNYTLTINKNQNALLKLKNGVIIEDIENSSNSKISVNDFEIGSDSFIINTYDASGMDSLKIMTDKGIIYLTILIKESDSDEEYGLTSENVKVNFVVDGEVVGTSENKYTIPEINKDIEYTLNVENKNAICTSTNQSVIRVKDNVAKLMSIPRKESVIYIVCRDKEGTKVYNILKNVFK